MTNPAEAAMEQVTGLVLGRFQPLHPGHMYVIDTAMTDCDEVVICIGSAQRNEPYSISERHDNMQKQLTTLYQDRSWRIVDLVDPEPMEVWPEYVTEQCGLDSGANKRFYRSDRLEGRDELKLHVLGFEVMYLARLPFWHKFPDGLYRQVSSSTEIKAVYHGLDVSLPKLS